MAEMEDMVEYLAIGSMMNKVSLNIRGVFSTESRPACLPDYELGFAMADGFAAARRASGKKLHGVLHRISRKEVAELDIIKFWYVKEKVHIKGHGTHQKFLLLKQMCMFLIHSF